ncbi:MAG: hypothetical protein L0338_21675 [Acidobacteria bacterium]|nr:hypothetical protein [Acidobacteriota bacterium]
MSGRRSNPAEARAVAAAFNPNRASWPGASTKPEQADPGGGKLALALLRWLRDLPSSFITTTEFAVGVVVVLAMDTKESGWSRRKVRRLAADAKIQRQTAYRVLERLIGKGIILRRSRGRRRSPLLCINPALFMGAVTQEDKVVSLDDRRVNQG